MGPIAILRLLLLDQLLGKPHVFHRDVSFLTPAALPCGCLRVVAPKGIAEYSRVVAPKGIAAGPSMAGALSSQLRRALLGDRRATDEDTDIMLLLDDIFPPVHRCFNGDPFKKFLANTATVTGAVRD